MSVTLIYTSATITVTMSVTATDALVDRDLHSHMINLHVEVRKNESNYLLLLTQAYSR